MVGLDLKTPATIAHLGADQNVRHPSGIESAEVFAKLNRECRLRTNRSLRHIHGAHVVRRGKKCGIQRCVGHWNMPPNCGRLTKRSVIADPPIDFGAREATKNTVAEDSLFPLAYSRNQQMSTHARGKRVESAFNQCVDQRYEWTVEFEVMSKSRPRLRPHDLDELRARPETVVFVSEQSGQWNGVSSIAVRVAHRRARGSDLLKAQRHESKG
jgi:hypothetical protein